MSNKPDQRTMNKCMLQILNNYVECDCKVLCIKPFYMTEGFSITFLGRMVYEVVKQVSIFENEEKRTFIFQVDLDKTEIHADDVFLKTTLKYLYIGEITEDQKKDKVLYECDRRACHEKCSRDCYHTTDITHAKHFEYENGTWVERHSYPEVEV